MNKKYVMNMGLAFSEESDMKKLKNYAKKGWILEGISGGLLYKLRKDTPRDIEYSLDYQWKADEEYFSLFSEAGWSRVVSAGNEIHIFSAPEGTKPIYSDKESVIDKYARMKKQMGQGAMYSLAALIVFALSSAGAAVYVKPIFLILSFLSMASIVSFVFTCMPYLAYSHRLRKLRNSGLYQKRSC